MSQEGPRDRLLRRIGVQPRPFRALLRTFVTLDLRGQFYGQATGAKPREVIPPLYWVVAQMLTVSLLLCAVLQGRVEAEFYAFASLSATAVFVFSAVVVEFREAAFDPLDVTVVGHRPVTARTWSAARALNLTLYVTLIAVSLTIFPTGMGLGLRDTGPEWLLFFPWANAIVAISAAAIALALYAFGDVAGPSDGLKTIAAWTQIAAIMGLFYGGQMMLRDPSRDVGFLAANPPTWLPHVPTHPLAVAVAGAQLRPLLIGTVLAAALAALALGALARAWSRVSRVQSTERAIELRGVGEAGTVAGPLSTRWFRDRHARAVFWLTRTTLRRDSELRARSLPAFALAFSTAIVGALTGQYADPSVVRGPESVLPIATVAILATTLPTVMHNLGFSDQHRAVWRLEQIWGRGAREGARTAVLTWGFWPLALAHALLTAWLWRDPVSALLHLIVALGLLDLVSRLTARTLLRRPIARRPAALGGALGGGVLGVVAGTGALTSVLGALWFFAAADPRALAGLAVVLFVSGQGLVRMGGR